MVIAREHRQRIACLTPLDEVTQRIAGCVIPVAPRDLAAAVAVGTTLAEDVTVSDPRFAAPLALIDGWAVPAELSAYADADTPTLLTSPREIAAGETLGVDADAVVPLDAVTWRGGTGELPMVIAPGDGRLDAAVAVWLLIGRPLLARLCGGAENEPSCPSVLTAKVASTVGLTELILVRRAGDGVAPLASKYLPPATLAHADGWIVIPAASDWLAPGAPVTVRPLP
jgi:molybdopterin biosynthesis enzyme